MIATSKSIPNIANNRRKVITCQTLISACKICSKYVQYLFVNYM